MKTYHIDLSLPEEDRWAEVIEKERRAAKKVIRHVEKTLGGWVVLAPLLERLYRLSGGRYVDETRAWAEALNVSPAVITAGQCSYELSQTHGFVGKIFGCTSAVVSHPDLGPTHLRLLDWELPAMEDATRVFTFHRKDGHEFSTVGVCGFVGVLSGVVRRGYSVAINQAPPSERPGFDFGAAFLVREVLETCSTYGGAVRKLSRTRLAAPVFFTVCGVEDGQACIIERLRGEYAIRKMNRARDPLVVTNHHVVDGWDDFNDPNDLDTVERLRLAEKFLSRPAASLRGMVNQLSKYPIYSSITTQRMAFHPRSGGVVALAG